MSMYVFMYVFERESGKLNQQCDVTEQPAPDWSLGWGEDGGLGVLYKVNERKADFSIFHSGTFETFFVPRVYFRVLLRKHSAEL